ncbi:MAG: hypothetical protein NC483_01795 [Ruminococcus sp.]|nr:hypothetical protein [Ruminococcus sp.]
MKDLREFLIEAKKGTYANENVEKVEVLERVLKTMNIGNKIKLVKIK